MALSGTNTAPQAPPDPDPARPPPRPATPPSSSCAASSPSASSVVAPSTPQPSTTPSSGTSAQDADERAAGFEAQLRRKRIEIDAAIEAFRLQKEAEFQDFERRLRDEDAARVSSIEGGSDEGNGERERDIEGPREREAGAQRPLDLGGSLLEDRVRLSLAAGDGNGSPTGVREREREGGGGGERGGLVAGPSGRERGETRTQTEAADAAAAADGAVASVSAPASAAARASDGDDDVSPPYEKELQAAGLFTPSYLPLLENRHRLVGDRSSPPQQSAMDDPSAATTAPSKLAAIPASSRNHTPGSPALPLASSLKSSSSGSFGTPGSSTAKKIKSPKKVTFHFDDENSVPSRSSPPPAKVTWSIGTISDDEDGEDEEPQQVVYELSDDDSDDDVVGEEYVEDATEGHDDSDDDGSVQQVEDVSALENKPSLRTGSVAGLGVAVAENSRYPGESLVIPTSTPADNTAPITNGDGGSGLGGPGSAARPGPSHGVGSARAITRAGSPASPFSLLSSARSPAPASTLLPPPAMTNGHRADDDDDDEGLFDLDETIPDSPPRSPPRRDLSALDVPVQPPPATTTPPPPQSFSSAAGIPLPPSAPSDPCSFVKTPFSPPSSGRSGLASSFSRSFSTQNPTTTPIASSLPAWPTSSTFPRSAAPPSKDAGRFRRRSINKYIPSPPSEEDVSPPATAHPQSTTASAANKSSITSFGTSLPIAISPRPPSFRSPPLTAATSTRDVPDDLPLSARPSPISSPGTQALLPLPEEVEDPLGGPLYLQNPQSDPNNHDHQDASPHDLTTELLVGDDGDARGHSGSSSEVDSYNRTARFPSAPSFPTGGFNHPGYGLASAYRTKFAQDLAEAVEREGNYGESVVGGVDGRSGLDPGVSVASWGGSLGKRGASTGGMGVAAGSAGRGGTPVFSLSMRLAMEEAAAAGRR